MSTARYSRDIILAAILGFESQKSRIDEQIAELRRMLGPAPAPKAPAKRDSRLSPAGREAIARAARKRWAAVRAAKSKAAAKKKPA